MWLKGVLHLPILSIGEVASALIDLQGALTWTLAFILLHSAKPRDAVSTLAALKRCSAVSEQLSLHSGQTVNTLGCLWSDSRPHLSAETSGRCTDLWQLRQSRSTVLQAQKARESHVSLTMPANAFVPGILVRRYLEQWLPWTRLVRSP